MDIIESDISTISLLSSEEEQPASPIVLHPPPSSSLKKLWFSETIEEEIGINSISYRDVTSNPLYALLEINSVQEMEIMLRISTTFILGKQPGLSTFDIERSRKWAKFLEVADTLEEDIHDLIIEIWPYHLPSEGRWQISDLQGLVEVYE